jgi:hypothetical protein
VDTAPGTDYGAFINEERRTMIWQVHSQFRQISGVHMLLPSTRPYRYFYKRRYPG